MLIIPAIDLQQGQCVRLQQGQFDKVSVYTSSPQQLTKNYTTQGMTHLHVVDLDGAKAGTMQQLDLIQSLCNPKITIQAGGGIRSMECATRCINAGIMHLVLGSIAVSNPTLTLQIIERVGAKRIVLALDVHMVQGTPKPAINGWQTPTSTTAWDLIAYYQNAGVARVLCTDIACDGMMNGPNFTLYKEAVLRFPTIAWQASGGIRHIQDIRLLDKIGIAGVILGRMLYESEFNLSAGIEEFTPC
jgi:phosphoribosylformimino-5-aminoimidazole carboxamide ribotide isomerase